MILWQTKMQRFVALILILYVLTLPLCMPDELVTDPACIQIDGSIIRCCKPMNVSEIVIERTKCVLVDYGFVQICCSIDNHSMDVYSSLLKKTT